MAETILLVEDDPSISELLSYNLKNKGYTVICAEDGLEGLQAARTHKPDLLLLDWMLPSLSGIEVCRQIRADAALCGLPILMITARAEEDDLVEGLETGADDYITKPFSNAELIARIQSVLRRSSVSEVDHLIHFADISLDTSCYRVTRDGTAVKLGPLEFRLLRHFMENPKHIFSRDQLLERVWRSDHEVDERTVDVHIRRLRKAMNATGMPDYIKTIRSLGYTLDDKD